MPLIVEGVLRDDAQKCTRGLRDAVVVFVIDAGDYLPYEVAHKVGERPEDHLEAERIASRCHRGDPCAVRARRIGERRDHGEPCMVLREVLGIRVAGVLAA